MQREIIEYFLIADASVKSFIMAVNSLIDDKWQPKGKTFRFRDEICQVMVKYKETECKEK